MIGLLLSPKLMLYSPKKDGICAVGEGLSTGILAAVPSVLFPRFKPRHKPHTTLICSTLPPQKPRLSSYEGNIVHWPFKWVPVSLSKLLPLPEGQKPHCFSQPDLCGHLFQALLLWVGEPRLGFRPHSSQREPPRADISL